MFRNCFHEIIYMKSVIPNYLLCMSFHFLRIHFYKCICSHQERHLDPHPHSQHSHHTCAGRDCHQALHTRLYLKTRIHSSRMRTERCSRWGSAFLEGVCLLGGGLPSWRGSEGGMPSWRGYAFLEGVCLLEGGLPRKSAYRGVCLQGLSTGGLTRGVCPNRCKSITFPCGR